MSTDLMTALPASATDFGSLQRAPSVKAAGNDPEKMRKAVEDFEAFFISQSFQMMFDSVPVNETFGGGSGEKMFRSMLIDEYGKMAARSGGIGITDKIMSQMLAVQEV